MNMFYFLTSDKISGARLTFQKLEIKDWHTGDHFFEKFGPGNTINFVDRPYERFNDYELLLKILRDDDPQKYLEIHKGTPFYFLAWTAFGLKDYERAVFYMDAAISEDQRKVPNRPVEQWIKDPASQFLTMEEQGNQSAKEITVQLRTAIDNEFKRFNEISKLTAVDIDSFVKKFVIKIVENKKTRSIITALYSFVLEFTDRYAMLNLRSKDGGSIEPILTHLFKGGLIFESLLKQIYPQKDNGSNCNKLGDIFNTSQFKNDFSVEVQTSANSIREIVDSIGNDDLQTAFSTTSKLRNTSGHNLVWDDVFNDPQNYQKLYKQVVNSILYIVAKKFYDQKT